MANKEALGLMVKQKRETLGMTAVQLAEEVGVTQRYIYKIEAGEKPACMEGYNTSTSINRQNTKDYFHALRFAYPKIKLSRQ